MLKESDQEKNVGNILVFVHLKLHCHNHVETRYFFLQTSKEKMDLLGVTHDNYVLFAYAAYETMNFHVEHNSQRETLLWI
jgi:hypothetical protein